LADEDVPADKVRLERSIAMRYLGQWRSMDLEVARPLTDLAGAADRFHAEHHREFSYRRDGAPGELYRLQLTAIGETERVRLPREDERDDAVLPEPVVERDVWFDGEQEPRRTPVFHRDALPAGLQFVGPAIIDQLDSTTLVPPGVLVEIDEWRNIRMHITEVS